jgi:hypothetical protein
VTWREWRARPGGIRKNEDASPHSFSPCGRRWPRRGRMRGRAELSARSCSTQQSPPPVRPLIRRLRRHLLPQGEKECGLRFSNHTTPKPPAEPTFEGPVVVKDGPKGRREAATRRVVLDHARPSKNHSIRRFGGGSVGSVYRLPRLQHACGGRATRINLRLLQTSSSANVDLVTGGSGYANCLCSLSSGAGYYWLR